jgi:formate hydrogenlyase subunit 3/multisubunit Na+/H+ antiporter MnhD subunit
MSTPLLLIVGALVVAVAALGATRTPRALPWISGVGSGLLGAAALWVPPDASVGVFGRGIKLSSEFAMLGRTMTLSETNRGLVAFLFLASAFLFIGSAACLPGRHLYWAGVTMVASLACSLMIEPFLYAAVFLMVAAMSGVLILVDTGVHGQRGSTRLLAYYALAMMAILLAGWLLERSGVSAGAPELARRTGLLLALGVAVVLLVPPFHLWLPAAMDESHPYGVAFILLMLNASGLFFLLRLLGANVWLRDVPSFLTVFRVAGVGMMVYGSLTALAQRRYGRTLAYLAVADGGAALAAIAVGDASGYQIGLGLTGARVLSLGCWGLGLSVLRTRNVSDEAVDLEGAMVRQPWASAASLLGALGMAAYPMTSGFPGRWSVLLAGGMDDPGAPILMLVAGALAVAAVLRWTGILAGGERGLPRVPEGRFEVVLLGGGILLVMLVGAFPQLIYPWLVRAAAGLAGIGP